MLLKFATKTHPFMKRRTKITSLFIFVKKKQSLEFFERRPIKMLENKFQANLIKKIKNRFPDCIVMKNDSSYIQGIPDLTILNGNKWATLENKRNEKATKQPNQEYYVNKMNNMSFSRFIFPENQDEILKELYEYLEDD